jgi:hypothetical protein
VGVGRRKVGGGVARKEAEVGSGEVEVSKGRNGDGQMSSGGIKGRSGVGQRENAGCQIKRWR